MIKVNRVSVLSKRIDRYAGILDVDGRIDEVFITPMTSVTFARGKKWLDCPQPAGALNPQADSTGRSTWELVSGCPSLIARDY